MCSANMGEGGESSAGLGTEERCGFGCWDGVVETPLELLGDVCHSHAVVTLRW